MTLAAGGKVDAADFVPGISIGVPAWIFKSAGETVTNSIVMQDDDSLFFTLAPGARYEYEYNINVSGPAAADVKTGFTGPADITGIKFAVGPAIATTTGWVSREDTNGRFSVHGLTTVTSYAIDTAGSAIREYGWIESATGGTMRLQWAQNTANVTGVTLGQSCYLRFVRVL